MVCLQDRQRRLQCSTPCGTFITGARGLVAVCITSVHLVHILSAHPHASYTQVWRNDLHNLQLLLEQGANVEQRDAESGW